MRRRFAALVGCLLLAAGLTWGCTEEKAPVVAVSLPAKDTVWSGIPAKKLENRITRLCDICEYSQFEADRDPETQVDQVRMAVADGASVVIVKAVDPGQGAELAEAAGSATLVAMDEPFAGADYFVGASGKALTKALSDGVQTSAAEMKAKNLTAIALYGAAEGNAAAPALAAVQQDLPQATSESVDITEKYVEGGVTRVPMAAKWVKEQIGGKRPDMVISAEAYLTAGATRSANDVSPRPAVVGVGGGLVAVRDVMTKRMNVAVVPAYAAVLDGVADLTATLLAEDSVEGTTDINGVKSIEIDPLVVSTDTVANTVLKDGIVTGRELCEPLPKTCARMGLY